MERPRRGVRLPLCERAPGMGGRRRGTGAGDDMLGCEFEEDPLGSGCIYSSTSRPLSGGAYDVLLGHEPRLAVRRDGCAGML